MNSLNLSAVSDASNRGVLLPRNLMNNLYVSPPSVEEADNTNALLIPLNATNQPAPRRKFLCDTRLTKRVAAGAAALQAIAVSNTVLGEGTYGRVYNGEIAVGLDTGETLHCVAAVKMMLAQRVEIAPDILKELGAYARLQGTAGVAQGLFFKFAPQHTLVVMSHYLQTVKGLFDGIVRPYRQYMTDVVFEGLLKGVLYQILTGVATLEANSILHRDIKPANLLVGNDGTVYVADYGLLVHQPLGFEKPQTTYHRTGTPYYLAPEMIQSTQSWRVAGGPRAVPYRVDGRADIWSVGCVMLYCILGVDAFNFPIFQGLSFEQSVLSMTRDVDEMYRERRDDSIVAAQHKLAQEGLRLSMNCWQFLRSLLHIKPTDRPTARAALRDAWFLGMTPQKARAVVQTAMSAVPVPPGTPNQLRQLSQQIRQTTAYLNNPASQRNAEIALYTQLRSPRGWAPSTARSNRTYVLSMVWTLAGLNASMSPLILLHAIELFERVYHADTVHIPEEAVTIAIACLAIANKLTDFYRKPDARLTLDILYEHASPLFPAGDGPEPHQLQAAEQIIVKDLGGDVFVVRGSLVETVCKDLLEAPSPHLVGIVENVTFFKALRYYLFLMVYSVYQGGPFQTVLSVAESLASYLHPILIGDPNKPAPPYVPVQGHAEFVAAAVATPLPQIGLLLAQLKAWSFHFPRLAWADLFGYNIPGINGPGYDIFRMSLLDQFGEPYPNL